MTSRADVQPEVGLPAGAKSGVWWPLRLLAWLVAAVFLSGVVIAPLDTWSQTLFAVGTFGLCWILSYVPGRWVTLTMIVVSITVSLRYLHWRISTTVGNEDGIDMALGLVLLAAELYAVLVLVLGYIQSALPLERKPVALPGALGLGDGGRGDVHGRDVACAPVARVDREAAVVAEDVEHATTTRHAPDAEAVLALVEEVAGLLAVDDVHVQGRRALAKGRQRRLAADRRVALGATA